MVFEGGRGSLGYEDVANVGPGCENAGRESRLCCVEERMR